MEKTRLRRGGGHVIGHVTGHVTGHVKTEFAVSSIWKATITVLHNRI